MTTLLPVQCFACSRLDRSTAAFGQLVPERCAAYPARIPADVRTFGDDHRQVRGDEQGGLTFEQADTDEARLAFTQWQRFAAA